MRDSEVRRVFIRLFLADVENGGPRDIAEYLELFPGHEALVSREDARLRLGRPEGVRSPQRRVGPFLILSALGRGGQGEVYVAEDLRSGHRVALKVLTQWTRLTEQAKARFRREAAVVSRLDHPAICRVLDSGIDGGVPYIAMELVEGETLRERIARARSDDQGSAATRFVETCRLLALAAQALHSAHVAGVVHRDVNPANIMIDSRGNPVVLDFGLARDLENHSLVTRTGDRFGTPAYMAPEQAAGTHASVDARADVFALGVTLYEALTLTRPFGGETAEQVMEAIQKQAPRDPRSLAPDLPDRAVPVLYQCLEKDPADRYATADEVARDLHALANGGSVQARRSGWLARAVRWIRREPRLAGLSAGASVLLLAAAALTIHLVDTREELHAARSKTTLMAAEQVVQRGFLEYANGELRAALGSFRRAITLLPHSVEARVGACLAATGLDDYEGALSALDQAPKLDEGSFALPSLRRNAMALMGVPASQLPPRVEQELGPLEHFVLGIRENTIATFAASPASREKHQGRSLKHFRIAAFAAKHPRALYHAELGRMARSAGDTELLAEVTEAASCSWPDGAFTSQLQASLALLRGEPKKAASLLLEAIRRHPNTVELRCGLASAHIASDDWDRAWTEIAKALALGTGHALPIRLGAIVQSRRGEHEDVVSLARRLLARRPHEFLMRAYLGRSLVALGRPEEAIPELQAALVPQFTLPSRLDACIALATAFESGGSDAEAERAYESLASEFPEAWRGHAALGEWHLRRNRPEKARKALEMAHRTCDAPDARRKVRSKLASALATTGRAHEAVALCRAILREAPQDTEAKFQLGFALDRQGDLVKALEVMDGLVASIPNRAPAHVVRANSLLGLGRFREALAAVRRAEATGPLTPSLTNQVNRLRQRIHQCIAIESTVAPDPDGPLEVRPRQELAAYCDILLARGKYARLVHVVEKSLAERPSLRRQVASGLEVRGATAACRLIKIDPKHASKWRRRALGWLREILTAWIELDEARRVRRSRVVKGLEQLLIHPDLQPVRDETALAALDGFERRPFLAFWAEVRSILSSRE